jgi:hypothetical protein
VRRLALVAATGVALLAGCSTDYAPVDDGKAVRCLDGAGQRTARGDGGAASGRPGIERLVAADGVARVVRVARTGDETRPWALLIFYRGAERAADAAKGGGTRPGGLHATRRQNVVAVFGRHGRYGRAPARGERRLLRTCLQRATAKT